MKKQNAASPVPSLDFFDLPARIFHWFGNLTRPGFTLGHWWLPALFTVETFLFLPMDFVLAGYCYKYKDRAYTTALFCAICSTFSALLGYLIGFAAWEQFGQRFFGFLLSGSLATKIIALYQKYQFSVVFLGGILPIPTKSVTISAGLCKLSLPLFLSAMLLARIIRFLSVAYIATNYAKFVLPAANNENRRSLLSFIPGLHLLSFWM